METSLRPSLTPSIRGTSTFFTSSPHILLLSASRRSVASRVPFLGKLSRSGPIRSFVAVSSSGSFTDPAHVVAEKAAVVDIDVVEVGGGGGGGAEGAGGEGSGGGGGDGGGDSGGGGNGGGSAEEGKKMGGGGMSMSQKITLAYAALVGVGGVIGFLKSGSQKSLAAGGISALLLCFVYTQLPVRPAFASSLGLGLSGALLAVMGSRFRSSGKLFPAGVVSLVSLVMVGGYAHGIMRGLH